jgi:hypothetical protein
MAEEKVTKDLSLYRRMSEPFESRALAEKALDSFYEDIKAVREKHKIREVVIVAQTSYAGDDGESDILVNSSLGNHVNAEAMLAYALGVTQTERRKHIDRLLSGK